MFEDIPRFNVPVDHTATVNVLQTSTGIGDDFADNIRCKRSIFVGCIYRSAIAKLGYKMNDVVPGIFHNIKHLDDILVCGGFEMLRLFYEFGAAVGPIHCGFARVLFQNFDGDFAV